MIKKLVIIADKKQSYIDVLRQLFEDYGYQVFVKYDGITGIKIARKEKPELVFIENNLTGYSGYQICSLIKLDVKYQHIVVTIISDKNDTRNKKLVKLCKADGYIVKPINFELIINQINQLDK